VEESFFVGPGERANTGEAGPTLVFGGNHASYQGIDLLLASFAKALQQRPDLRLRLITEDSLDAYEQLAGQLGVRQRIELVKASLDELPHLLAQASVLVNPRTEGDGTPQKVLNYMAAGRPIVSFAGTARHLVDDRDALIVPNGDTDAFARAVLRLCADDDLAARIGGTAQRTARAEFTWARTADRVEQIYASLVPARS
jgi:glycosyltransferase involved in cell wall biosynthesis